VGRTLDRFGKDVLTGESNTGDCEDMAAIGYNTYMTMKTLHRAFPSRAKGDLLDYAVRVWDRYMAFACGSMVTSAYLDEKGQALDMRQAVDLPLKTSDTYMKAETGGHCHLLFVPRAQCMSMLREAGQFKTDAIHRALGMEAGAKLAPWETHLPKGMGEGTAALNPFGILAAAETHASLTAETDKIKALKKALPTLAPTLAANFRAMSSSFYSAAPAESQRATNSFFRMVVHMISPEMFDRDPRMAQFLVCDMKARTRGADAEVLMRDKGTLGLVSPLADITETQLRKEFLPVYQCIAGQQPLNTSFRFKEDHPLYNAPTYDVAMSRVGHVLSTQTLNTVAQFKSRESEFLQALDRHGIGMRQRLLTLDTGAGIPPVPDKEGRVSAYHTLSGGAPVLTFFSKLWKLTSVDMAVLEREFNALRDAKLINAHVFWRERAFPQCDDQLSLGVVLA
jgi:hypothetical protein